MKRITSLFLVVVMALSMFACTAKETTKDILDNKGNVVGKGYYTGKDLEREELYDTDGRVSSYKSYKNGNVCEEGINNYDENGKISKTSVKSYDEKKRLTKEVIKEYSGENKNSVTVNEYKYDKNKNYTKTTTVNGKKTGETKENEKGQVLESATYDENGSTVYIYDENELMKESKSYNEKNELSGYTKFSYNEDGLATGSETFDENDNPVLTSVYEYNGTERSKILMYNPDGTLYKVGVYDSNGKLTLYNADEVPAD